MEIKSNVKNLAIAGVLSSATTLGAYKLFLEKNQTDALFTNTPSAFTRMVSDAGNVPAGAPGEFTYAAEKATPAVVHIKTKMTRNVSRQMFDPFEDFFGFGGGGNRRSQPETQEASGSGVIISADGYIVTNNHVVQDADEVTVILNDKRELKAKVISTDPSTDIAVIQVKTSNLPFLTFGDSDAIKVGEWVLAVGNPFNLESTVTAGIVSAKGRQNIIDRDGGDVNPLESFIQTDAAVNPGNSGGALVNLKGELIGINTAIYSRTGQFAGYSFAVPVGIVKKVAADLIKYGNVQRGYLGVNIGEVNAKLVEEKDLKVNSGVYVAGFAKSGGSAAQSAGLKVNDVIVKIDGIETKSMAKLMELVGRKRPGETVVVTVNRDGELKDFNVTLKNKDGNTNIIKGETVSSTVTSEYLGAKIANLTESEKAKFKVKGGAKLVEVDPEGRIGYQGFENGFVITKIDDKEVGNAKEVADVLANRRGKVRIEGVDLDGTRVKYEFYLK
ncbi:Do family serine endopeptidase [Arcicella rigui]|uniref:Do family serine endopeptidase n=1 Tax=Arcicella rigui TaxID=797020 RepID=A0ABU5QES1_9BACT|nr:Do family serine endopeptidase [Arcicella rigui]MEA5141336.1 Do family serine endopeptidase [Arcicella rigui]